VTILLAIKLVSLKREQIGWPSEDRVSAPYGDLALRHTCTSLEQTTLQEIGV
jgi:hypothetical protein